MKTIFVTILFLGITFCSNSQDDKKTPEKKLTSGTSNQPHSENKPARKLVDKSTTKSTKTIVSKGKPERLLIDKKQ